MSQRLTYGAHPAQHADLYRPGGDSVGVVVVIHGGFWKQRYDASLGVPLARDLAAHGWTALNLEYRRVGGGGGYPHTLDDVAAGIDLLAGVPGLDLGTVITLGHSAGGHLATWAAARGRYAAWQPVRVPVTAVVSQAGVLDLRSARHDRLGDGAVERMVGGADIPADADPIRQAPLEVPVRCVHGKADDVVPLSQSRDYVKAATDQGGDAELVEVEGDHFVVVNVASRAWATTIQILEGVRN